MARSPLDDDLFSPPPEGQDEDKEIKYDFSVDLDGGYQVEPDHNQIKCRNILIYIGAILGLIGLAFLVTYLVAPNTFRSAPVRTTIRYYEYLNEENYEEAAKLLEPGANSWRNLAEEIRSFVEMYLPWDFPYTWDFVFMEYKASRVDAKTVLVQVDGNLRIINTESERFLDFPYSKVHTLIKKNGRWYLRQ